jgi:hypothetical protein
MAKPDFTLEFIKDQKRLIKLSEALTQTSAFALDIETVDWWNRRRERIALIQIAFRYQEQPKVAVIDALADLNFDFLRAPLESTSNLKVIHNAAFDAARLSKHYDFTVAPIYDTMLAARRAGERKYSLQAQAAIHLQICLDKSSRQSDWSRRPLDNRQLSYAALDSYSTLLLYENQVARNLTGDYRLKPKIDPSQQGNLPLDDSLSIKQSETVLHSEEKPANLFVSPEQELDAVAISLLGIVTELPTRYSPGQLSVSLGGDRIGLAGWIADSHLGRDVELDEETVKMTIADLCERDLLQMTATRRLEATETGSQIWRKMKPK